MVAYWLLYGVDATKHWRFWNLKQIWLAIPPESLTNREQSFIFEAWAAWERSCLRDFATRLTRTCARTNTKTSHTFVPNATVIGTSLGAVEVSNLEMFVPPPGAKLELQAETKCESRESPNTRTTRKHNVKIHQNISGPQNSNNQQKRMWRVFWPMNAPLWLPLTSNEWKIWQLRCEPMALLPPVLVQRLHSTCAVYKPSVES